MISMSLQLGTLLVAVLAAVGTSEIISGSPAGLAAGSTFGELCAAVTKVPANVQTVIEIVGDLRPWEKADGAMYVNGYDESIILIRNDQNVIIRGTGQERSLLDANSNTSFAGRRRRHIEVVEGATLEIDNLRLINGDLIGAGAINNLGGTLTVMNSEFTSNGASFNGGAIKNVNRGTLTVMNSEFTSNKAGGGGAGAIYNEVSSTLIVMNTDFTYNTGEGGFFFGGGGAVYNSGLFTATDCKFTGNTALGNDGGAVYNSITGSFTATDCKFTGNTAGKDGGAVYNKAGGTVRFAGSTRVFGNNPEQNKCADGEFVKSVVSGNFICAPCATESGSFNRYGFDSEQEGFVTCAYCPAGKYIKSADALTSKGGSKGGAEVRSGKEYVSCDESPTGTFTCSDGEGSYGENENALIELSGPGNLSFTNLNTSGLGVAILSIGSKSYSRDATSGPPNQTLEANEILQVSWTTDSHMFYVSEGHVGWTFTYTTPPFTQWTAAMCQSCGVGKHNPKEGAASPAQCLSCPPGRYGNSEGAAQCIACPRGRFLGKTCLQGSAKQPGSSSLACELCPENSFQEQSGQATCRECSSLAGKLESSTFGLVGAYSSDACMIRPKGAVYNVKTVQMELLRSSALRGEASNAQDIASFFRDTKEERDPICDQEMAKGCPNCGANIGEGYYRFPPNTCIDYDGKGCPKCPIKSMDCIACPAAGQGNTQYACSSGKKGCGADASTLTGCSRGFAGVLCASCDVGYRSAGDNDCAECSSRGIIRVVLFLSIVATLLVIAYFIKSTIQSEGKAKDLKIMMLKLLASHMQVVALIRQFPLEWPSFIVGMFNFLQTVSTPGPGYSSYCEFDHWVLLESPFYADALFVAAQPLIAIGLSALFWIGRAAYFHHQDTDGTDERHSKTYIETRIVVSTVVILFFMHISLTKTALSFFSCIGYASPNPSAPNEDVTLLLDGYTLTTTIPTNSSVNGTLIEYGTHRFLRADMRTCRIIQFCSVPTLNYLVSFLRTGVECYTGPHLWWAIVVGGGMIVFYSIGIPVAAFILLFKIKDHPDAVVQERYGFLFSSYKKDQWYWEVVVVLRKVAFAAAAISMASVGADIQTITGVLIVVLALAAELQFKPYIEAKLDNLETAALFTQFFTLIAGIFMFSSNTNESGRLGFTFFITMINVAFLLYALRSVVLEANDWANRLRTASSNIAEKVKSGALPRRSWLNRLFFNELGGNTTGQSIEVRVGGADSSEVQSIEEGGRDMAAGASLELSSVSGSRCNKSEDEDASREAPPLEMPMPPKMPKNPSFSLPDGWTETIDEKTGKPYYYNETTGERAWVRPSSVSSALSVQ